MVLIIASLLYYRSSRYFGKLELSCISSGERTRLACSLRRLAAMFRKGKVRDGEGAIASTRGRMRSADLSSHSVAKVGCGWISRNAGTYDFPRNNSFSSADAAFRARRLKL